MRAEAERDALRLTSDSRRDKEELLRVARLEADGIIEEARTESDGVMIAANKQAEAAQERARALEDRRSELLSELEATRTSISQLEDEIDSRRQALETPEPMPEPEPEPRSHHSLDSGSVKIVAPSKVVTLRPVDPDELVADVEAIRFANESKAREQVPAEEPQTVAVIAPPPPPPPPPLVSVATPARVMEAEPEPEAAPEIAVASEAAAGSSTDEIGSLFARLRDDTAEQPVVKLAEAGAGVQPEPEPTRKSESKPKPKAKSGATQKQQPAVDVVTAQQTEAASVLDAPLSPLAAQNAALKAIKRSLVDLQNETLEALRTDETWMPDEGFTDRFEEPFADLGESVDADAAADAGRAFASDLHDAVTSAIEAERAQGAGSRAVASTASKVFRTWRSDEAERRLSALTP